MFAVRRAHLAAAERDEGEIGGVGGGSDEDRAVI